MRRPTWIEHSAQCTIARMADRVNRAPPVVTIRDDFDIPFCCSICSKYNVVRSSATEQANGQHQRNHQSRPISRDQAYQRRTRDQALPVLGRSGRARAKMQFEWATWSPANWRSTGPTATRSDQTGGESFRSFAKSQPFPPAGASRGALLRAFFFGCEPWASWIPFPRGRRSRL